jgi:hypothetical protein
MLDEFQKFFSEDNSFQRKLEKLETELAFLSDPDQRAVLGYRVIVDTGGTLPPGSEQDVNRMLTLLINTTHNVTSTEAPLSLVKVVRDLRGAQTMLSSQELQVLNVLEPKIQNRQPLSVQEVEALFSIYSKKGF